MKQKFLKLICLLMIAAPVYAQKQAQQNKVNITWNILQDGYQNPEQTLSELTINNISKTNFPSKGWTIYFNAANPKTANQDSLQLKVTHINGDFFKITPGKNFKGLAPQQKLSVRILTRGLKNITDYAKGFYLIYDQPNSKPLILSLQNKSSIDYSGQEKAIANTVFEQNALITKADLNELPPVLPTPTSYERTNGKFQINKNTKVNAATTFTTESKLLVEELSKVLVAPITTSQASRNVISLKEKSNLPAEGYELEITPTQITIYASKPAGAFYGIQSLKGLLPNNSWKEKQKTIEIAAIKIKDEPRFGHRAFMMDISRNFLPKSQIIKTIDALSFYKINVLHLHFNDDEGWRIEIEGLPELTEVGSKRGHTLTEAQNLYPSYGSGPFTNKAYGSGYLSKADFIEILKYANARHIKVIPEYETPGHARAAIKAMDARYAKLMKAGKSQEAKHYLLRDLEDQSVYRTVQGFNDNVINPALPSVYNFIGKIIDETVVMYKVAGAPLHTIHFGGDEVPNGVWEKSPAVKALMEKDKSIESVDEMWHYYFKNVSALLKAKNLYLSGWEEIGLKKQLVNGRKKMVLDTRFVKDNFHTDVWNNLSGNEDLAYLLANAGYKVVLTNVTNMYLDLAYSRDYNEPGQYWGGYVDVDKPYNFIPFDYYKNQTENKYGKPLSKNYYDGKERLKPGNKNNIIGIQAPLWSEIITSKERFEYLFLPKILGLAERAWAADPIWANEQDSLKSKSLYQKDWSAFINLLGQKTFPQLDHYAGGFEYRIPTVGYKVLNNQVGANVLYPNLTIRYTLDGTEPTSKSAIYKQPIPLGKTIKLRAFNIQNRGGRTTDVRP
jgi:hexosaminidase